MAVLYCADCGLRKSQDVGFCLSCTGSVWVDYGTSDATVTKPALIRTDEGYFQPANLLNRVFAWLIDFMIVYALLLMVNVGAVIVHHETKGIMELLFPPAAWSMFAFGLYYIAFECSAFQGTPGKTLLQLRVCDAQGKRLSFWRSLTRYLARLVSGVIGYLGNLAAFVHPRKLTLHDLLAGTVVMELHPVAMAETEEVTSRSTQYPVIHTSTVPGVAVDADYEEEELDSVELDEASTPRTTAANGVLKLDLNHATEQQLAQLPGIGMILAKKAIRLRVERKGFQSLDDFVFCMKLKPHHLDRLAPLVMVSPILFNESSPEMPADSSLTDNLLEMPPIDLNRAPLEALLTLPGLDAEHAGLLIQTREKRQGFQTVMEVVELLALSESSQALFMARVCITPIAKSPPQRKARMVDY